MAVTSRGGVDDGRERAGHGLQTVRIARPHEPRWSATEGQLWGDEWIHGNGDELAEPGLRTCGCGDHRDGDSPQVHRRTVPTGQRVVRQ